MKVELTGLTELPEEEHRTFFPSFVIKNVKKYGNLVEKAGDVKLCLCEVKRHLT
jgi:hypothetical protein